MEGTLEQHHTLLKGLRPPFWKYGIKECRYQLVLPLGCLYSCSGERLAEKVPVLNSFPFKERILNAVFLVLKDAFHF